MSPQDLSAAPQLDNLVESSITVQGYVKWHTVENLVLVTQQLCNMGDVENVAGFVILASPL